jgi:hypothetical protein
MNARINTSATFPFLDASGVVVDTDLLVYDVVGAVVGAVVSAGAPVQSAVTPELFLAAPVVFTQADVYTVRWLYDDETIASYSVTVGQNPKPDATPQVETTLRWFTTPADGDFSYRVLDADGATVVTLTAADYSASARAAEVADQSFARAGDFFVVWYYAAPEEDALPAFVQRLFVAQQRGKETCQFSCVRPVDGHTVALTNVTVLISSPDGTPITRAVTPGTDGYFTLELPPGDYVATMRKPNTVFSTNNWAFEVVDTTELLTVNNVFILLTDHFAPTFTEPVDLSMATLFGRMVRADGEPIANARIMVELVESPYLFDGVGVFGTTFEVRSDAYGYFEFAVVQGSTIDVSVSPASLRRRVTVPTGGDAVDPVNLFTLLSAAPDPFEIRRPTVPLAPKRS